jgi:hypothetical protein
VALQAGRSRVQFPTVLLEFFVDLILPVLLVSSRNDYQENFLGVDLTTWKSESFNLPDPRGPLQVNIRTALPKLA